MPACAKGVDVDRSGFISQFTVESAHGFVRGNEECRADIPVPLVAG
jgi:hypothetical protein